jgi:tRNA modification GTPase
MYDLNDTIVAVSSPSSGARAIVRITGPDTIKVCWQIFTPRYPSPDGSRRTRDPRFRGDRLALAAAGGRGRTSRGQAVAGSITIDDELEIDGYLYSFPAPHSYTGDDLAEIHIYTNSSATGALMGNLLGRGLRPAGPGEFTARAYLNGKIDLAQAEAVNEVVVSSNTLHLAAAQKLLSGRLAQTTEKVRSEMIDCLTLIEAGLDFSGEDIEFISRQEALERLTQIKGALEQLLSSSIRYESVVDLPAVGIAGAPNAGKSSLANKLLGVERSIVSAQRKTTRDVLTGLLTLTYCRCVLFDCAGLICDSGLVPRDPIDESILDGLAHAAAIEALRNSAVVVFCVDISKADWSEDLDARSWILDARRASRIEHRGSSVIPVATKCDLLSDIRRGGLANRLSELNELFATTFLATSVKMDRGIELLRQTIDGTLLERLIATGGGSEAGVGQGNQPEGLDRIRSDFVGLTARHRQVVNEAIQNINESIDELKAGPPRDQARLRRDEIVAMMLRAAYEGMSGIGSADRRIDEQILEQIFSRFCIGK